jgi:hypothetical protein
MLKSLTRRTKLVLIVVLLALLAPVGWYLGSPLFINQVVDDPFPAQRPNAPSIALERSSGLNEPLPVGAVAIGTVKLGQGEFRRSGVRFYDGEGSATIYHLTDGRRILRFEGFRVTNGPGLYVYLSGASFPTSGQALRAQGSFEVARLRGNVGNQNYELPKDLDLERFNAVVIYCKPFSAVFAIATLQTPMV